jgi:hypothetical protein
MGGTTGGPTVAKVPAPAPLFPGVQQNYINSLENAGVSGSAFNTIRAASDTGLPTDVGPAFDAMKLSMQHGIDEGVRDLKEHFGGGLGLSGGSDLLKAGADFESQTTSNMNSTLAQWVASSQEAAANRRVQGATTGAGFASEPGLAFRPTGVVAQQPGLIGPLLTLFSTLFPNFDLGANSGGGIFGGTAPAPAGG